MFIPGWWDYGQSLFSSFGLSGVCVCVYFFFLSCHGHSHIHVLCVNKIFHEKNPTFLFPKSWALLLLCGLLSSQTLCSLFTSLVQIPCQKKKKAKPSAVLIFGRDLFLHSWTSKNRPLFLLPLAGWWLMLHLPLMWQKRKRWIKSLSWFFHLPR